MKYRIAGLLVVAASAQGIAYAVNTASMPETAAGKTSPPTTQAAASPVVLELFASQSCSSCPPADRLAKNLAKRGDVLVISRPVTYGNRLGWEDTLSQERNTELQRAYAARGLAGYNGVYTPQAVVDGRVGAVGSDRDDVSAMLAAARDRPRPELDVGADGKIRVAGQRKAAGAEPARLLLIAIDIGETVAIGRGENRDRTITYTNVFLDEQDLGAWRGGEQVFSLPPSLPAANRADRWALLLREGNSGAILAGRWLPL